MATEEPPRLTLREAEAKLLSFRKDDGSLSTIVELRRAFEPPPDMAAEDIFVEHEFILKDKAHGKEELANKIADHCVTYLGKTYSATSTEEAKLILKLYICDINSGKPQDRILATETGKGLVRLTLAWILTLEDGSVVLDGGRLFECSHHMFGIGDVLRLQDSDKTLHAMGTRMSDKIKEVINIKSRSFLCGLSS